MGKEISIADYAKKHGKSVDTIRARCLRGAFKTAKKISPRCWVIDEDEPYIDHRSLRPSVLQKNDE